MLSISSGGKRKGAIFGPKVKVGKIKIKFLMFFFQELIC